MVGVVGWFGWLVWLLFLVGQGVTDGWMMSLDEDKEDEDK